MTITFTDPTAPRGAQESGTGKLAECALRFTEGPLAGLQLIGFTIWERRGGSGYNVTFPARAYTINGERRSYALLRPTDSHGSLAASEALRDQILTAYAAFLKEQ